MAPPVPPGYVNPYPVPPPTIAVHRTPWMLIIAAVVALVVLMAGCGTALAVFGSRAGGGVNGPGVADLPSPTPATSPSPVASPTSTPSGPHVESNDGLSVMLPAGWTVADKDSETLVLYDPGPEGQVTVASGSMRPVQTAQENMNEITNELKAKYPDTRTCPNTRASSSTLNGAKGFSWTLCFTVTSGASSLPAAASIFAGANSSGSIYYIAFAITRQDNLSSYVAVARPVLTSIQWKLS